MKNREKTFYELTTPHNLGDIYDLADNKTSDMFYEMGWFDKWGSHLRIYNNNIGFLDKLEGLVTIELLHNELESQFNNIHYYTALEWLDNTLLICKDRFRKSGEEILNEAIKWCETKKGLLKKSTEISIKKIKKKSLREIALMLFYKGQLITRVKSKTIAIDYGYTSGDALYNHFSYYSTTANRKGKPNPYTEKKLKNKISLFENVINQLEGSSKVRALDELNILKTYFENDFE